MKILIISYAYFPSVGGIETVTRTVIRELVQAGHDVRVVTHSLGSKDSLDGVPILRRPSALTLWRTHLWCDVCLHSNISLTYAWPMFLKRRPWVNVVHGATGLDSPAPSRLARLKLACLRRGVCIAVSEAIARAIGLSCRVIGNPLTPMEPPPEQAREGIVFLGRLVSDKGADFLLRALAAIPPEDRPLCTIIGDGEERSALEDQVRQDGLEAVVRFTGMLSGPELWKALASHELMAVPSQFDEPFGVVAIEGIACGCFVLASNRGGLPEAIGPCGLLLPHLDPADWAKAIVQALSDTELRRSARKQAAGHLRQFDPPFIAKLYMQAIEEAIALTRKTGSKERRRTNPALEGEPRAVAVADGTTIGAGGE